MDYKIVEKPAFRVVGVPSTDEWELEDAGEKAVQYWVDVEPQVDALLGLSDGEPAGLLGVQFCRDGAFDGYMACVATQAPCPDAMAVRVVPAAAFATIVAGIVATDGMSGLVAATIIAGVLLIVMGVMRLGTLIRFVPHTITTGFTAGIAVTIVIGQLKDFMGLTYPAGTAPIESMDKLACVVQNLGTLNVQALAVGLAVLVLWPRVTEHVPASLVAVLAGIALVSGLNLSVNTIGDLYSIQGAAPRFVMPQLSLDLLRQQLPNGFTIAGMVHAVVLLAVLVLLMPYATLIPMPCIPTTSPCEPWGAPALLTRLAARISCPTSTPPSPAPPFWWTRSSEDGAARVCRYNGKVQPLRKRTGIKPHGISC